MNGYCIGCVAYEITKLVFSIRFDKKLCTQKGIHNQWHSTYNLSDLRFNRKQFSWIRLWMEIIVGARKLIFFESIKKIFCECLAANWMSPMKWVKTFTIKWKFFLQFNFQIGEYRPHATHESNQQFIWTKSSFELTKKYNKNLKISQNPF